MIKKELEDFGKFTEPPWVIDNRSVTEGGAGHVVAECPTAFGSITVRAPHTAHQACPPTEELDSQGMKNAALIIAAPDLLAALKKLEEGVRLWMTNGVSDDDMKQAQAAIAKAEVVL